MPQSLLTTQNNTQIHETYKNGKKQCFTAHFITQSHSQGDRPLVSTIVLKMIRSPLYVIWFLSF